jgi:hypothetical protein
MSCAVYSNFRDDKGLGVAHVMHSFLLDASRPLMRKTALCGSHTALDREAEMRALRDRHATLSRREREVMALVVSGLLNKQVGGELGIRMAPPNDRPKSPCPNCKKKADEVRTLILGRIFKDMDYRCGECGVQELRSVPRTR